MEPRMVMEGYRSAPGAELDESADPGQRAVLREAAAVVAEDGGELVVEVFGNSPPWWATVSGSVTGDSLVGKVPRAQPRPPRSRATTCATCTTSPSSSSATQACAWRASRRSTSPRRGGGFSAGGRRGATSRGAASTAC